MQSETCLNAAAHSTYRSCHICVTGRSSQRCYVIDLFIYKGTKNFWLHICNAVCICLATCVKCNHVFECFRYGSVVDAWTFSPALVLVTFFVSVGHMVLQVELIASFRIPCELFTCGWMSTRYCSLLSGFSGLTN